MLSANANAALPNDSNDENATRGRLLDQAMAFAEATPTRRPVKDPGPRLMAMQARSS